MYAKSLNELEDKVKDLGSEIQEMFQTLTARIAALEAELASLKSTDESN